MRQVISFDRVKLTNNEMDDKGHVGNPSEHALLPLSVQLTDSTTIVGGESVASYSGLLFWCVFNVLAHNKKETSLFLYMF